MSKPDNFGANLRALKEEQRLSLTEFSAALNIPRTTLQSVLENGQTTLDTACRISEALEIPLSVLTDDRFPMENVAVLHGFLMMFGWYSDLSKGMQQDVASHIQCLLEALRK